MKQRKLEIKIKDFLTVKVDIQVHSSDSLQTHNSPSSGTTLHNQCI